MPELSLNNPFYAGGLRFSCMRCSTCCRFEAGYVFLSVEDTERLKADLNLDNDEFLRIYCRWIPSYKGLSRLSLKEKKNYDCIFWEEGGCTVYDARPLQCRAFPFWDSVLSSRVDWEMTSKSCPGVNKGSLHSEETIRNWLLLSQEKPIITGSDP